MGLPNLKTIKKAAGAAGLNQIPWSTVTAPTDVVVGRTAQTLRRVPKAGERAASNFISEARKEIAQKGSPAQRFSDAPLGQYYLPGRVQSVLSVVAPSPRKVARDTKGVIQNPRSPGNVLAEANNAFSIATLPALVTGGVGVAKTGAKAAGVFSAAKGIPLGERIGLAARASITENPVFHGTTRSAAKAIRKGGFSPVAVGEQYVRDFGAKEGAAVPTFVTDSAKTAAGYARTAAKFASLEGKAERPAIVIAKTARGAKPVINESYSVLGKGAKKYGSAFAYNAEDVLPVGGKVLKFPDSTANVLRRTKARVFEDISGNASYSQTAGKLAAVKQELSRVKNMMGSERGALGGSEDVVRRANARARGIKFAQTAGKLVGETAEEIKARASMSEGWATGFTGAHTTLESRSRDVNKILKGLKTRPMPKPHPGRLPRS